MTTRDRRRDGFRVSAEHLAEHPDADPTATELVINLLRTAALVQNRLDQLLRPSGLAAGSFNVLQIVAGAGEPITPTQITERLGVPVTTATLTGVLDTLQRRELVERRPHPDDRRRTLVVVTPSGHALLRELVPRILAAEREWTGGLGKARRIAVADELGALQAHLRGQSANE